MALLAQLFTLWITPVVAISGSDSIDELQERGLAVAVESSERQVDGERSEDDPHAFACSRPRSS